MTSKEIVKRLVAHDSPPRFALDLYGNSDFAWVGSRENVNVRPNPYDAWGDYPELRKLTGFTGEIRRDICGNIYGRFNGKTKGECIRGAVNDWDEDEYYIPEFDPNYREKLLKMNLGAHEKYILCYGSSLFSSLRDARLMPNALADTILEPDRVVAFIDRIATHEANVFKSIAGCGIDGMFFGDDWGTQDRTFISPESFRELFKPYYKKMADAAHEAGMSVFFHSCGYIHDIIPDFIDAGIDVFQFDQPDAYPSEVLASEFGDKASFHSPVDIQKVLPTGNRELIEMRALEMCNIFRNTCGGSWIPKDYPTYNDIGVEQEWATWARDVILKNCNLT